MHTLEPHPCSIKKEVPRWPKNESDRPFRIHQHFPQCGVTDTLINDISDGNVRSTDVNIFKFPNPYQCWYKLQSFLYYHQIRVSLIKHQINDYDLSWPYLSRDIKCCVLAVVIDMIGDTSCCELYIRFQLGACRRPHFKPGVKMANTKTWM